MATDLSAFQKVLEAIQTAQTMGAIVLLNDKTTHLTDDHDCYPRGLLLDLGRTDPKWHSLRFLSKHLDWVSLDTRRQLLNIAPPPPIEFRVTEVCYLRALAESLNESGIQCVPDVRYR